MTTTKDRDFPSIVRGSEDAALHGADPLARLPRVRVTEHRPSPDSKLPAVGSFS